MLFPDLERIERAKEERRLQLLKWTEYDRHCQTNFASKRRKGNSRSVGFRPEVVFIEAASRGDLHEVQKLIESGINPDVSNEDGLTALHQCCIDNNLEMCMLLMHNNANVNAKDNELWTPLHAAATCGNKELCSVLINWGADLLALNVDGNMPYDLCDDEDTLILIEKEMTMRHVTQEQIDEIRRRPEMEMMKDLKRHYAAGDDLQALDLQGAAPIHIAAACGYAEVVRYLLQVRVDPQEPDADGWLPIHIAASWGHLDIIELLVSYGADLEAPTKCGQTVYSICDSKEFRMRLKEVWDRRDELRKAVKGNAIQSLGRGHGSLRRRSNSSILRTSMRDKRRLTRTAAEREKQLGEQVEAKLAREKNENSLTDDLNHLVENPQSDTPTSNFVAPTSPRQLPVVTLDHHSTAETNNIASVDALINSRIHGAPSVPPRTQRATKTNDVRMMSPQAAINTNTTITSTNSADTSSTETMSESSDSQASYVRPMHRTWNGQMIPMSADSARSPSSQRSRTNPPSRDNRSRTPRRSDAPSVTPDYSNAVVSPKKGLEVIGSPSNSIRHGRQPPTPPRNAATTSSSKLSTDTINSSYVNRRKPFSCCHTM